MWLGIWSGLFAVPTLLGVLGCFWGAARVRDLRRPAFWGWMGLLAAMLTGRRWLRLLRPERADEPQPLTPTRRGTALGHGEVRLEWEQFGPDDAPCLLLSHGWSLTHDTWYYQKKALAGEFRVIVWDMRGTGRSGHPPDGDYSLEAVTADLAAVFDTIDAGRHAGGCVLAGHSVGAMILIPFAARYPKQMAAVRGLALLAGTDEPILESMWGRGWLVPLRRPFWEPLGHAMGRWPRPFEMFVRFIERLGCVHLALMFGGRVGQLSRGDCDLVARHCAGFSMRAAGRGALSCFAFDVRGLTPCLPVPTLLLTGEGDHNMPPAVQRAMAARLPEAEVVLLPACGHLSLLECPDAVNDVLRGFARRCFLGKESRKKPRGFQPLGLPGPL